MVCFSIGFFGAMYFGGVLPTNIIGDSIFYNILVILGLFLFFILSYLIHIVIHEAGHLIFGLATGYTFVSFRVGSFTIIREDGKFKLKRYNIPGTGGQCLMMPPDLKDGRFPFVIYNFGGVIMNLLTTIISILIVIFIKSDSFFLNATLIIFSFAGFFGAITNGIPLKISGVANDAHNVKSMINNEDARRGFYLQLKVNGLLSQGMRIKDMDYSLFKTGEDSDISSPLNTGIKMMEYEWHLDHLDFDSARESINSLVPYLNDLLPLYRFEINCERIFLELIGECDKRFIDRLYNKQLKKYVKTAEFMLNKKRLLIAYEAFYNEDKYKTLIQYKEFIKVYNNYPVKGEGERELMIVDWMIEEIDTRQPMSTM